MRSDAAGQIVTDVVGSVTETGNRADLTVSFSAVAPTRTEAVALLQRPQGWWTEPNHGGVSLSFSASNPVEVTSLGIEPVTVCVRCTTTWDVVPPQA